MALEFGNVEQGFAEADEIFEDTFFFQGNTHLAIEQHASVAVKDPEGKLTIWSSTQTPHYLHRALAKVLEMPAAHIRVIATPNGGGFGGKSDPFNHEIVVAKAALVLDRPVKVCLTREEVFYCHRGRHPILMKFKTGVKKDGAITGMHLQTLIDGAPTARTELPAPFTLARCKLLPITSRAIVIKVAALSRINRLADRSVDMALRSRASDKKCS